MSNIDKDLLQPLHFQAEEKPIDEKALQVWKAKYDPPEPEWISIGYKEPKYMQYIYIDVELASGNFQSLNFDGSHESDFWCDKEEHDKRVRYFNYHQVKYPDWKKVNLEGTVFENNGMSVSFDREEIGNEFSIESEEITLYGKKPISRTLFNQILKDHG